MFPLGFIDFRHPKLGFPTHHNYQQINGSNHDQITQVFQDQIRPKPIQLKKKKGKKKKKICGHDYTGISTQWIIAFSHSKHPIKAPDIKFKKCGPN